ncbi:putative tetratricopeptide-like helical domain superfamily [Helianthus anomalus]
MNPSSKSTTIPIILNPWKPIYKFHIFSQAQHFNHTPTTLNKMLDIIGKSKNIDLLWDFVQETGNRTLVTDKTYIIVVKILASAREMKKCVDFFHIMNGFGHGYDLGTLNKVVESLCGCKLVEEVMYSEVERGSNMWNLMVDEGFVVGINVVKKMMDTLCKTNRSWPPPSPLSVTTRCHLKSELTTTISILADHHHLYFSLFISLS